MSDIKKFEEMLERLINEDKEGAEELFHEIVVEKSREIYESLLESDLEDDEVDEASDEDDEDAVEEAADEDDEDVEEASKDDDDEQVDEEFDLDEFEVEADPMATMGGDPADDMQMDIEVPGDDEGGMGDDEEGGSDIEDRVMDLEDALDDLKAEFDKLMSGEEGDDDMGDDEEGDMDVDIDADSDDSEEDEKESVQPAFEAKKKDDKKDDKKKDMKKSAAEEMREYVEKVGGDRYDSFGKMGDNGTNTKSPVAGKNDMGGTASNLVQGKDNESGDRKGFAGLSPKEDNAGNVNVPGAKGATSMKGASGHGAEKKGKSPERSGADSPINGVKSRAK